jgi:lipid-A-disaccharide synthase
MSDARFRPGESARGGEANPAYLRSWNFIMKTVMIVAGESSGELYGSLLAKALKSRWPEVRLVGIGGERMRESGVEILSGISSSFGITELFLSIRRVRESFKKAAKSLTEISPDVVVLIDYPDFNFRLAKIAKKHGMKVLYYVSPQVWAWRKGRVKTMGRIADRVAAILPFEEKIYRQAGIPCEFVGHPIMEEIEQYEEGEQRSPASGGRSRKSRDRSENTTIALLPGSRPNELKNLLPVFISLARMLKDKFGDWRFLIPLAPNVDLERFREYFAVLEKEGVEFRKGGATKTLASSDMAVIASGTASLQAALLGIPMVVVYKLSPITYFIGKAALKVTHISLVNIISGRDVVPELIQHEAEAGNIMKECEKILYDDTYRTSMISSFGEVRKAFSGKKPSLRVAEMVGEMAGWSD